MQLGDCAQVQQAHKF